MIANDPDIEPLLEQYEELIQEFKKVYAVGILKFPQQFFMINFIHKCNDFYSKQQDIQK